MVLHILGGLRVQHVVRGFSMYWEGYLVQHLLGGLRVQLVRGFSMYWEGYLVQHLLEGLNSSPRTDRVK